MFGESSGIIGILRVALSLAEYLQGGPFALTVVETKSIASRPNRHYTDGHANFDIVERLALLEMFVLLQELANTRVDVEFVWVRVRALGLAEVIDVSRANLEVLLLKSAHSLELEQCLLLHWDSDHLRWAPWP